jgi:GAF domain-containing protein
MTDHPDDAKPAPALGDPARLSALQRSALLDTPAEERFDRITRLASAVLGVPVTLVSLVDNRRQFFESQHGLPEPWASQRETPLSHSFCQHVVSRAAPLVVSDARQDPLVRDNLAVSDMGIVAYAGIPITSADGQVLGSFCAIDTQPHEWTEAELRLVPFAARHCAPTGSFVTSWM